MLTKNLLAVRKDNSSDEVSPVYRHPKKETETAEKVLSAYEPGKTKREIWDKLEPLETHSNFKFLRGLSKIIERNSEFVSNPASQPEMEPREIRERLWENGIVTSDAERNRRLAELAQETPLTTVEIDDSFWGDREENEELVETVEVSAEELVKKYNLSLTQTLLFNALRIEFEVGGEADYQKVFSNLKRLGLMYTVDEELRVSVTGPGALFKKTRKYGNEMAKLLPTILEAEEWELCAKIETEAPYSDSRSKKVYDFKLSSALSDTVTTEEGRREDTGTGTDTDTKTNYLPMFASDNSLVEKEYDSEVERSFASRIEKFTDGWNVTREPTILRVDYGSNKGDGKNKQGSTGGVAVMIPDFGFENETSDREFYVEIVGFWTPDYLADKIEKVRNVETKPGVSLILAVNENLRGTESEFGDVDEVFFYDKQVPVKPIVRRLNSIEEELKKKSLLELSEAGIGDSSISLLKRSDGVVDIEEVAELEGYEPSAVSEYLSESDRFPGVVYKERYVPREIVDEIRKDVDSTDLSLPEVRDVLGEYGLGESFLEQIGYEVKWRGFGEEDAEIVKKD